VENSKLKRKSAIAAIFLLTSFFLSVKIPARPPEVNKYFSLADEELLSGKYDKAIADYLKGMMFTTWKTEAEVFDDLGYAYLQENKLQKAKKYLTQSIGFHRQPRRSRKSGLLPRPIFVFGRQER
jgi:tetratricopeptide (TPR) repeat protein